MAEKYLGLKFDADAMVHLLGVQLYDTPLAMLRENDCRRTTGLPVIAVRITQNRERQEW